MDKDKIELKTTMESAAVAEYLTALAKGFKSGIITVEKGEERLTFFPVDTAEVEVEARVKKDKARFSLEVSWRVADGQDDPASLKISAGAAKPDMAKSDAAKSAAKDDKKPEQKEEKKAAPKPEAKADAKDVKKDAAPMVKVISTPAVSAPKPAAAAAEAKAGPKA